jgi:methylmalonyl-CoA mutase
MKPAKTVLGITGTGGSGLVDELVRRFLVDFPENNWFDFRSIKTKTGGALLGDRIG